MTLIKVQRDIRFHIHDTNKGSEIQGFIYRANKDSEIQGFISMTLRVQRYKFHIHDAKGQRYKVSYP